MMKFLFIFFVFSSTFYFSSDFENGIKYSNSKNWSVSNAYFLKHLKENPIDEHALFNLGINFYKQKKYIDAIYYFEKAYKLNPALKECIPIIEESRKNLGIISSWTEPFYPLTSKFYEITLAKWSLYSIVLSFISAFFLLLFIKKVKFYRVFLILFFFLFSLFLFSLVFTYKKSKVISSNTHALVIHPIYEGFLDEKSNQHIKMQLLAGERIEILSENNRIKIRLRNENIVYLLKKDLILF